jgi:adenylate cyclase
MPILGQLSSRQHKALSTVSVLLVVWALFVGLGFTKQWEALEHKEFDLLSVMTAPGSSSLPITIVAIDEASFAAMNIQWPWPRGLHAQLVNHISNAGATVIAFDMLFSENSTPQEDQKFAQAIKNAGTVVLAADQVYQETGYTRQWVRVEPLPLFRDNGGVAGLTTVALDSDLVIRKIPESKDVFWREVIAAFQKAKPGILPEVEPKPGAMIRYLGPAHTFPFVPYHQILSGDKSLPDDFFKDQIVLVGRDVRATPEAGAAQADTFSTPFINYNRWLTPGVEIHATIIENIINQQTINPADRATIITLLTLVVLLATAGTVRWHPLWSGLYFLLLLAIMTALAWWLFGHGNYWLPLSSAMSAVVFIYIGMAMLSYFTERRRGREIKSAFSRYVSAQVVDQMIAHPERLQLGGERRELTLLFCDLAGFTTISEGLPPDTVAKLINAYLGAMTRVIMASGGTVDKFIGDAVMAFWGAPLDDQLHALHACEAARAMQVAMHDLKPLYAEHGVHSAAMRVGIHSGIAIVGNMGSDARFDYTALGDAVNLASRLEGVNKMYGTGILISANTAEQVSDKLTLRRVDKVRVKGKQNPVEIFTFSDDSELNQQTESAIEEYRNRNWKMSTELWFKVAEKYPDDGVAQVYLERIEEFQKQVFPDSWDGSVALDKM